MAAATPRSETDSRPPTTIGEEMAAIPYEPLLPVEKRLIVGSLLLGLVLLGVLSWASSVWFPITAPEPIPNASAAESPR